MMELDKEIYIVELPISQVTADMAGMPSAWVERAVRAAGRRSGGGQTFVSGIEAERERFPVTLGKIEAAIDAYVEALLARQNGNTARDAAFEAICAALVRERSGVQSSPAAP